MALTLNSQNAKPTTQLLLFSDAQDGRGSSHDCTSASTLRELTSEESTLEPGTADMEIYVDVIDSFHFQYEDRFGGGTPYPSIPNSQRVYDGNNWFEFCESIF